MTINLDRVRRRKVRFWAIVDSSLSYTLALPPLAQHFISLLYSINGKLGGSPTAPAFTPLQMFFVCLSGSLIGLWCIARYLKPIGLFALIDGWGRVWVSLLIIWFVAVEGAPRVVLLFVITEMLGAIAQLHEVYFRKLPQPVSAAS
ncbi:MAG: hypothetical protein ABIZ18_09085 [Caldimonas sp.]